MRYTIPALVILLFFTSCSSNNSSQLSVFRATDEGLRQSITTISISNNVLYKSLEARLTDRDYSETAKLWYPKAMQVKLLCDSIYQYINLLKEDLKSEAGPAKPADFDLYNEDNVSAVNRFSGKNGKQLFEKLMRFRQDILAVDPNLSNELSPGLIVFAIKFDYTKNDPDAFTQTFFNNTPAIAAMAMLSKFENNVKVIENDFIGYCHSKTYTVGYIDEFPQLLVSQSKNYVKGGEQIEINAGIGVYSTLVRPRVTISNIAIPVNTTGVAVYRFKTSEKPGKHVIPVRINYTKADGAEATVEKSIEYIVLNEK